MLRWLEITLYTFLLYVYLALGINLAVWEYSSWQIEQRIYNNRGFHQRLYEYSQVAQAQRPIIDTITVIQPVVDIMHQVKSTGTWDITLSLIDRVQPGSRVAIEFISPFMEHLISLRDELATLSKLDSVAYAVDQFLRNPSKVNRQTLSKLLIQHTDELNRVAENLAIAANLGQSFSTSMTKMTDGLETAGQNENRIISSTALGLFNTIKPLQTYSMQLGNTLEQHSTQFNIDFETITYIIQKTQMAEKVEAVIMPGFIKSIDDFIYQNFWYLEIIVLTSLFIRMDIGNVRTDWVKLITRRRGSFVREGYYTDALH